MNEPATTLDAILNRRVALEQPAQGFRVAVDTVLLAAAVPALAGDRILDLGCGVGGAMLALACRVAGVKGQGIELQNDLVEICRRNIARNSFATELSVAQGDATQLPAEFHSAFDHVLMNPPYHDEQTHDVSTNAIKRTANSEKAGDLSRWIASAHQALKPSGTLTLIHRADRRDDIIAALQGAFGDIEILSLLPKQDAVAKRLILRARKAAVFSIREASPLVLHKESGAYSDAAEETLRHAQALTFQSP